MVMWNSADPLSPSSWLNAHDPISRPVSRTWMPMARLSVPRARIVKKRSISSGRIGPSWYRVSRATSGSWYQRRKSRRLSRVWRRSTTSDPSMWSGNQRRWSIGATVPPAAATIARMRRWAEVAERVAATTRTSEKTAILAAYLPTLDPEELPIAAVFLTGRPFPEADQRSIGIGWAGLTGAVLRVAGADGDALRRAYDRFSDVSAAVAAVLDESGHHRPPDAQPTLVETSATFEAIEQ